MIGRHPLDGRVHFSELKEHNKSPAHVVEACRVARTMTRPMMVGGVADSIVFGQRGYKVYPGKVRNGQEWESFREKWPGHYLPIASEAADAEGAAHSVQSSTVARSLLDGCEFQIAPRWDCWGLPCAAGIPGERGGFDAINFTKMYIVDLKITSTTKPEELDRHAFRSFWHAQGVWYCEAACEMYGRAEGQGWDFFLLAVESKPPHCVVARKMSPASYVAGQKLLTIWTEQQRQCEASGHWPGYTESIGLLEPPAYLGIELDE